MPASPRIRILSKIRVMPTNATYRQWTKSENKTMWRLLLAVGLCVLPAVEALAQNSFKLSRRAPDVERWIKSAFARGRVPPFSFVYDGQSSASFIRSWTYQAVRHGRTAPGQVAYTFTYTHPQDGLRVSCDVTGYPDYGSVDWILRVENTGTTDSGPCSRYRPSTCPCAMAARAASS